MFDKDHVFVWPAKKEGSGPSSPSFKAGKSSEGASAQDSLRRSGTISMLRDTYCSGAHTVYPYRRILYSLCGQLMPHEGAGLLPALLIDQGQLPPATKQVEAMNIQILPLAITMMAGPQIMAAIIFVTAPKPAKVSASFIAGVAIATTFGVAIALAAITLLGNSITLGDSSDSGSTGHIIQYLLVGALVAIALKNYLGRETVEPPKWLGTLMSADSKKALVTGLLVIFSCPLTSSSC